MSSIYYEVQTHVNATPKRMRETMVWKSQLRTTALGAAVRFAQAKYDHLITDRGGKTKIRIIQFSKRPDGVLNEDVVWETL